MQVDKETFRRYAGSAYNDALFDSIAVKGIITREQLLMLGQTTDCFLSMDWGNDCYGRSNKERVGRVYMELQRRGLSVKLEEGALLGTQRIVNAVCDSIDKTRCVVLFLTQAYINSVERGSALENCQMEYSYASRRKHEEQIICVAMEEPMLNPANWGTSRGSVGTMMGHLPFINYVRDESFNDACTQLFERITTILSKGGSFTVQTPAAGSWENFEVTAREETQFSQWMARSTKINESRRIVYCATLVRLGITSVQKLVKKMKEIPQFLTSIGITEFDADEIALAVGDLGLGYQPVRDFSGTSIESASYALKKCTQAPEDHGLASNALVCIRKVASLGLPTVLTMGERGFTEAVIKVMMTHLGDPSCAEEACKVLVVLASASPEMNELTGGGLACVMIPKVMQSHLSNAVVIEGAFRVVAIMSENMNNKVKLGISGACDVAIKALQKHADNVAVAEIGCICVTNLAKNHYENVSKLGAAGTVDTLSKCLALHPTSATVSEQCFRTVVMLAQDPALRSAWGNAVPTALVKALATHVANPVVAQQGCYAIHQILVGHAFNRQVMGRAGACEVVRAIVETHYLDPGVALHSCIAVYALAAGSPENQVKFDGLKPVLSHIANNPTMPPQVVQEAKEAFLRVR